MLTPGGHCEGKCKERCDSAAPWHWRNTRETWQFFSATLFRNNPPAPKAFRHLCFTCRLWARNVHPYTVQTGRLGSRLPGLREAETDLWPAGVTLLLHQVIMLAWVHLEFFSLANVIECKNMVKRDASSRIESMCELFIWTWVIGFLMNKWKSSAVCLEWNEMLSWTPTLPLTVVWTLTHS